jgi:hypothetical protein
MPSPPIEEIEINDALDKLGVISLSKKVGTIQIMMKDGKIIIFDIHKTSVQKTLFNLNIAALEEGIKAEVTADLKVILAHNYTKYLTLVNPNVENSTSDEEEEEEDSEDSDVKQHNVFKYSTDIPLAEQIKLGEDYVFLQIIDDKPVINPKIDLSKTKKIILYSRGKTPILDFEYKNEDEVQELINVAKNKTIDDIYATSKTIWKKFVKATDEQIVLFTADSIFTFFQDSFVTTHYTMLVAHVGSGKGAVLITFSYLGYRVILAGNMSCASILDLLGSLEMGQVVIAEDELNNLKSDSDKWNLYTHNKLA